MPQFNQSATPASRDAEGRREASRGTLLCETCWDAMTDQVLPGTRTATGLDEACCAGCWPLQPGRGQDATLLLRLGWRRSDDARDPD